MHIRVCVCVCVFTCIICNWFILLYLSLRLSFWTFSSACWFSMLLTSLSAVSALHGLGKALVTFFSALYWYYEFRNKRYLSACDFFLKTPQTIIIIIPVLPAPLLQCISFFLSFFLSHKHTMSWVSFQH